MTQFDGSRLNGKAKNKEIIKARPTKCQKIFQIMFHYFPFHLMYFQIFSFKRDTIEMALQMYKQICKFGKKTFSYKVSNLK